MSSGSGKQGVMSTEENTELSGPIEFESAVPKIRSVSPASDLRTSEINRKIDIYNVYMYTLYPILHNYNTQLCGFAGSHACL